ncbi:MAG: ribose 5-phosphate isomerase B [Candidatus Muiribacteriaceae bacterium]
MKTAIGNDHAGVDLKNCVKELDGYSFVDCGTDDGNSVDYPDIAEKVCGKVVSGECEAGILICGTGTGMAISANKIRGIRAAMCHNEMMAELARRHNNANVLCLGARVLGEELALRIARIFLQTEFEGGRHGRRVDKIISLEG